ncbi:hypothetical protein BKA70DRAFT_56221 [Coprinopsis sp. MPI-PUGE-AT-0042]|nr:hypothetical protein BKA70DRAFT_56221 [Coprinopsis sp. MPI-PUGE-AT-0042]
MDPRTRYLATGNDVYQSGFDDRLAAEDRKGATSLTQSLVGAQVTGGNVNVVGGNQHRHYHHHLHGPLPPSRNNLPAALDRVPNYRDIHGANLSRATPGTGPRFSKWAEFHTWVRVNGLLQTMWGSGMPGAGKTIFTAIMINEIDTHAQASRYAICVCYIYFRYSDRTTATVRDFLEVLVKQTVERHSNCVIILNEVYARHTRERTQPSEAELLRLLHRFSEAMEATFYFLDALDEAPPDVQLDLLEKLSPLNVKLFITSRPLPDLEAHFPGAHRFTIRAQDKDLDLHIAKEISRSPFLQTILKKGGPGLRQKIALTIKEKCGGMFLHASLQLDALRCCTSVHNIHKTLEDFPARIEDVYQQTWNRILDLPADAAVLATRVLLWVLCATRSLKIEELRHFVAVCPDTDKIEPDRLVDEATLMSLCRGLVNVEETTRLVRFVHYTAKDVLKRLISESVPYPHSIPAAACMAHLAERDFQRSTLGDSDALKTALQGEPLLAYAHEAWAIHAHESTDDAPTTGRLAHFIQGCSAFPIADNNLPGGFDTLEPLHMAAYFDLPLSVAGSTHLQDPNLPTRVEGVTPLILAIRQNSSSAVRDLLSLPRIRVNKPARDGNTPLMEALMRGRIDLEHIKLLLAHRKIDANARNDAGMSALMWASFRDSEATTLLLAHPAIKPNQADSAGRTALMLASSYGSLSVVQALLADRRVKVHLRSKSGETALDTAQKKARDAFREAPRTRYNRIAHLLRAHSDREHHHLSLQPVKDFLHHALSLSKTM